MVKFTILGQALGNFFSLSLRCPFVSQMAETKETQNPTPPPYELNEKWDACIDLSLRRFVYSSLAGALGGLLFFSEILFLPLLIFFSITEENPFLWFWWSFGLTKEVGFCLCPSIRGRKPFVFWVFDLNDRTYYDKNYTSETRKQRFFSWFGCRIT